MDDITELSKKKRRRIEDKIRKNLKDCDLNVVEALIDHIIHLRSNIGIISLHM